MPLCYLITVLIIGDPDVIWTRTVLRSRILTIRGTTALCDVHTATMPERLQTVLVRRTTAKRRITNIASRFFKGINWWQCMPDCTRSAHWYAERVGNVSRCRRPVETTVGGCWGKRFANGQFDHVTHSQWGHNQLRWVHQRQGTRVVLQHAALRRQCTRVVLQHAALRRQGTRVVLQHAALRRQGTRVVLQHAALRRQGTRVVLQHAALRRQGTRVVLQHAALRRQGKAPELCSSMLHYEGKEPELCSSMLHYEGKEPELCSSMLHYEDKDTVSVDRLRPFYEDETDHYEPVTDVVDTGKSDIINDHVDDLVVRRSNRTMSPPIRFGDSV